MRGLIAVRDVVVPSGAEGPAGEFAKGSGAHMIVLYASIFMLMFLMFIVSANISDILTTMGESMTVCGLILALMGLTQVFISIAYSRLKRTLRYQHVLLTSFALQAVAICMFASDSLAVLAVGVGVLGVGLGIGMPTITSNLAMVSPASAQGKTMGVYSCMMNLGTSLSTVVMAPVIVAIGYTASFRLAAAAVLLFGIAALISGRFLGQPEAAAEP